MRFSLAGGLAALVLAFGGATANAQYSGETNYVSVVPGACEVVICATSVPISRQQAFDIQDALIDAGTQLCALVPNQEIPAGEVTLTTCRVSEGTTYTPFPYTESAVGVVGVSDGTQRSELVLRRDEGSSAHTYHRHGFAGLESGGQRQAGIAVDHDSYSGF